MIDHEFKKLLNSVHFDPRDATVAERIGRKLTEIDAAVARAFPRLLRLLTTPGPPMPDEVVLKVQPQKGENDG